MNITTIFSSSRCKIRTRNGKRCKVMTKNEDHICYFHSSFNVSECCICVDQMLESDRLECGHSVCRGCLGSLRDTRCPMCRGEIVVHFVKEKDKEKMRMRYRIDREQDKMEEEDHQRQFGWSPSSDRML